MTNCILYPPQAINSLYWLGLLSSLTLSHTQAINKRLNFIYTKMNIYSLLNSPEDKSNLNFLICTSRVSTSMFQGVSILVNEMAISVVLHAALHFVPIFPSYSAANSFVRLMPASFVLQTPRFSSTMNTGQHLVAIFKLTRLNMNIWKKFETR